MKMSKLPIKYWDHQRKALDTIDSFRAAFDQGETVQAALMQMPTGSGKTGIIAVSAHFSKKDEAVLVLSPRVALCEQLEKHIAGKFFLPPRGPAGFVLPKKTILWEGGAPLESGPIAGKILICTIQKIQRLFRMNRAKFDALVAQVGLVLVDEGHYEPALQWRDAIRAVPAPKIIFTATPFRNDFKLFDIDFKHAFRLSFKEAQDSGCIRTVTIVQRRPGNTSPTAFVDDLLQFYEQHKGEFGTGENRARVIIRCDNYSTIRDIAAVLRKRRKSFVAIHERFNDRDARTHEFKHVPAPETTDATFWIHQYKLLEGIDEARFQVVAPYEAFDSVRSVVQQAGRVLRNPANNPGGMAYYLDYTEGKQAKLWENYLDFEKLVDREGLDVLDQGRHLVAKMQEAMPSLVYLQGHFRAPAVFESIPVLRELMLPLSANAHRAKPDLRMDRLGAHLLLRHRDQDHVVHKAMENKDTLVLLHVSFHASPLLREHFFLEPRLGATVVHREGEYVFFLDTVGGSAAELPGFGPAVPATKLRRLFKKHESNRLTGISLRGTNLGSHAIRTRSFSAPSIAKTLPGFDDQANVCTTARGIIVNGGADTFGRYLGFTNARISDDTGARVPLEDYLSWTGEIAAQLSTRTTPTPEFNRYAPEVGVPPDPTPEHILLEIDELVETFVTRRGGQRPDIPDSASTIDALMGVGTFKVTANGVVCNVTIQFDDDQGRYRLESADLDRIYETRRQPSTESVLHFLNREQAFRVIPATPGYIYMAGQFFCPEVKFGPKYNDSILHVFKLLEPVSLLAGLQQEKGDGPGQSWPAGSLFRLLDDRGVGTRMEPALRKVTLQICDDLGTEAADFIFVDPATPRVVLAHAKATRKRHPCSASHLQEVCGQAEKNARYLGRANEDVPPKTHKWHSDPWLKDKGTFGPIDRIRRSPQAMDGPEAWRYARATIRDWRTSNEIWLVLGNILSKAEFKRQLTAKKPSQESIQIAWKLFTTAQAANAVGARLRIFCMP